MKTAIQSIRILIVFTLLTGLIYPLAVSGVARFSFPRQAEGSLVMQEGKVIGSELIAQKFEAPGYFWPRPSGADYATVASGATNRGPTSADLAKAIDERRAKLGDKTPGDLLTASGSGLDPHISPEGARYQASRVAVERRLSVDQVNALVEKFIQHPQFGVFGEPRVNVFALNRALDELH